MTSVARHEYPERTCVGCAAKRAKQALVRLALADANRVIWDPKGKTPGRGAYVCPSRECFQAALKRNRINRAFGRPVDLELVETSPLPWE